MATTTVTDSNMTDSAASTQNKSKAERLSVERSQKTWSILTMFLLDR